MSQSTAGKGPGITLRAHNRSGAVRVAVRTAQRKGIVGVLEGGGRVAEIGLSPSELRLLARSLNKAAAALESMDVADEVTQS